MQIKIIKARGLTEALILGNGLLRPEWSCGKTDGILCSSQVKGDKLGGHCMQDGVMGGQPQDFRKFPYSFFKFVCLYSFGFSKFFFVFSCQTPQKHIFQLRPFFFVKILAPSLIACRVEEIVFLAIPFVQDNIFTLPCSTLLLILITIHKNS